MLSSVRTAKWDLATGAVPSYLVPDSGVHESGREGVYTLGVCQFAKGIEWGV